MCDGRLIAAPRRHPAAADLRAVAVTIGLAELTARARAVQELSFQVFEAFTAATLAYLAVNLIATLAAGWLESRVRVPGYGKT